TGSIQIFSSPFVGTVKANNDGFVVPLSGTAVYPLEFNPGSLSFPITATGTTTAAISATLNNYTSAAVPLGPRLVSPDFNATDNSGASLGAGPSCTFQVTFTPSRPAPTMGVITVPATLPPPPAGIIWPGAYYLNLNGRGSGNVPSQVTVTPAALTYAG